MVRFSMHIKRDVSFLCVRLLFSNSKVEGDV